MGNTKDLSAQQQRLLALEIKGIPSTYTKSAIIQSLVIDFNISPASVRTAMKANKSYISKCVNGRGVTKLESRPERKRLKRYLSKRVARATLTIRIFKVEDDIDISIVPVYLITTNGQLPDAENMQLLSDSYIRVQRRKDVRYKVKANNYEETDLLLSPYSRISVEDILKKIR